MDPEWEEFFINYPVDPLALARILHQGQFDGWLYTLTWKGNFQVSGNAQYTLNEFWSEHLDQINRALYLQYLKGWKNVYTPSPLFLTYESTLVTTYSDGVYASEYHYLQNITFKFPLVRPI